MMRILIAILAAICLSISSPCLGKDVKKSSLARHGENFSSISVNLVTPPDEYRPAPLWVWNTNMTKADIEKGLKDLHDAGFGGAFIHPRAGLVTEYLSDEWFDLYKHSIAEARRLGMEIWIYDENSYPSGFAGGHVPAEMPESYNLGVGLAERRDSLPPTDNAKFTFCLKKNHDGSFSEIKFPDSTLPVGDYRAYRTTRYGRTPWYAGFSYVDLLLPGVTEKFIELTFERYKKSFGGDIASSCKGIFSDEPNVGPHGVARWTPDLFDQFKQRWGYDLKVNMPLLNEDSGEWKKVRHNYMSTLTRLFIERWAEPMKDYCDRNNLIWTGHYWEHDWPRLARGGDSMSMYARHQMPAIDILFNQFNDSSSNAQFGNLRSVKELNSVANQMGQKRRLSETFGGGSWDMTFSDFKRIADWEYALGVNFMCQHLSHTSIQGARKYDYPPVFSKVSPWWNSFSILNDYYARLSYLLSKGVQKNNVLVLEPVTSMWAHYSFTQPLRGSRGWKIAHAFHKFISTLEKEKVEYDLGSELMMEDFGTVEEGLLSIGKASYSVVIIPPETENINSSTLQLLSQFAKQGGKIISFSVPTLIDGAENKDIQRFVNNHMTVISENPAAFSEVISNLKKSQDIKIESGGNPFLFHNHRYYDDGELVFLTNISPDEKCQGSLEFKSGYTYGINLMDGTIYPIQSRKKNNCHLVDFELNPIGSIAIFNTSKPLDNKITRLNTSIPSIGNKIEKMTRIDSGKGIKITPDEPNVIVLDFCDLSCGERSSKNLYAPVASDTLFSYFGRRNPWDSSVQYKRRTLESDTLKGGPIKITYRLISAIGNKSLPLRLVQEFPEVWKVSVNGTVVTPSGNAILDDRFGNYDISGLINKGENVIELSSDSMSIFSEIAPLYILGDFLVESADKGWIIKENTQPMVVGSWKGQGYPNYPWSVTYEKEYLIKNPKKRHVIIPGNWEGTIAEVLVNGQKAATIFHNDDSIDISQHLNKGKNIISLKVTGSLQNLYGPHFDRPVGIAAPADWKKNFRQPSGSQYDLKGYGLNDNFEIYIKE